MADLVVNDSEDAAAVINATAELTAVSLQPQKFDGISDLVRVVTPNGWLGNNVDLEQYAATPRRKRGNVMLDTTASLKAYIDAHVEGGTTVYADGEHLSVVAVINDHLPTHVIPEGVAGHRDHRATLNLRRTPGAARWLDAHGQYMTQTDFAQLIEDGLTEIASPAGADLLELAQTMQAATAATFRSAIRLDNGETQFTYVEEIDAKAGRAGDMKIPPTVTLVFKPFYGAEPMQLEARLRYRLTGGALRLGVWLIRHEEAIQAAFDTEVDTLRDPNGEGPLVLAGTPG